MNTIIKLNLNPDQLNIVLVALSNLPYHQVHELIEQIQNEVGPQLLEANRLAKSANTRERGSETDVQTLSGR